MPRGIGRAMEKALAGEEGETPQEARESLLMHPQRRELFRLLCLRPCAAPGELARLTGLSANAVRWHLDRLVSDKLLTKDDAPGTHVPSGYLEARDIPLFHVFADVTTRNAFRAILDAPGSTQREVCEAIGVSRQSVFKSAAVLEKNGLLSSIEDGRYRRYYPTGLLFERRDAHRPRARAFGDALLARLRRTGLNPEVLRRTDRQLLVRIAKGRSAEVLDLVLDPFTTVLQ